MFLCRDAREESVRVQVMLSMPHRHPDDVVEVSAIAKLLTSLGR